MTKNLIWFEDISIADVKQVGGKNASLGEMYNKLKDQDISVPGGFATTADAYRCFLAIDGLDKRIQSALKSLDAENVSELTETGNKIRNWIVETPFPDDLEKDLKEAFHTLKKRYGDNSSFAIRSSATAEDLPQASFAGQQETFLNISNEAQYLLAIKDVFASLYNDRAISYRIHQGFEHHLVALSAGVQKMVRSDLAASGVIFTIDTESGFEDVVFITSAYGLGEMVVKGAVNPDEFYVFKPSLKKDLHAILVRRLGSKAQSMVYTEDDTKPGSSTSVINVPDQKQHQFSISDEEVETLAKMACTIESHYGRPMDIEWAKDGEDGELYVVQARPETVKSNAVHHVIQRYELQQSGPILALGRSVGQRIGSGKAKIISCIKDIDQVNEGDVLITDMTDPDWEPVMKKAAAIVTNRGGRTCHAAIISRELGIPAVVGCGNATRNIITGQNVTVCCAEGENGYVYEGKLPFTIHKIDPGAIPALPFEIMMNVGSPDSAFDFQSIPNAGVGLARLEFIINRKIGVHPKALLHFSSQPAEIKAQIEAKMSGYADPVSFYIEKLTEGISTIAAAFYPKTVIVRLSDFKSNEYANLVGGKQYEPKEENPMIGYRGAARYISEEFQRCFELECFALKKVREDMGLDNVQIMVPFVRTIDEAREIRAFLRQNGLHQGEQGLKVIMMCEIPSNALLAEEFLQFFDGFSIGSNDLTQLTLGLDRDSGLVAELFDERNDAVKKLLSMAITACKKQNKYIGICGQGPSDHPDLALWLMEQGIDSVSLNPDSVLPTWIYLAEHLQALEEQKQAN